MTLQPASNIILASLFTGRYDVNRNEVLPANDFNIIAAWYQSIIKRKLHAIVFHNNLSAETVLSLQNEYVQFVQTDFDDRFNANIYRYIVYHHFLNKYKAGISNVFVTDITDVEVINNPFAQPLFLKNSNSLFCGDEEKLLSNEWMNAHSTHLRNVIDGFKKFEIEHARDRLLNCGIIGGNITVMCRIMQALSVLHSTYSLTNKSSFTLDMGAFNFVARTCFKNILHGAPINTVFKNYEASREDCWFRHK